MSKKIAVVEPQTTDENFVQHLPIGEIKPNPYQPRRSFDQQELEDLAASIHEHGVIQPIVVRHLLTGYELIAGERRLRASKLAQLETIPAIVKVGMSDKQAGELALVENLQRVQINKLDEAMGYKRLRDEFEYSIDDIAAKVSRGKSTIATALRVADLNGELLAHVEHGRLNYSHAVALLPLVGVETHGGFPLDVTWANIAINREWSAQQLEAEVKNQREQIEREDAEKHARENPPLDLEPEVASTEETPDQTDHQTAPETAQNATQSDENVSDEQTGAESQMSATATASLEQWKRIKDQYPDTILLFRVGDFYEAFGQDAHVIGRECEITITSRGKGDQATPMAGLPFHAAERYIKQLVGKGYKCAVCDQAEQPPRVLDPATEIAAPGGEETVSEQDEATEENGTAKPETTETQEPETKAESSTPAPPNTTADKTPSTAPSSAPTAPATPKVPDGMMMVPVPKDDCLFCQNAGVTLQDVFGQTRKLIELGQTKGLELADMVSSIEAMFGE